MTLREIRDLLGLCLMCVCLGHSLALGRTLWSVFFGVALVSWFVSVGGFARGRPGGRAGRTK